MLCEYEPFSVRMDVEEAEDLLTPYRDLLRPCFLMSLRYLEAFYTQQPSEDTLYFLNLPGASLLFYFKMRSRSFRANGFLIRPEHLKKAWLLMLPMIMELRQTAFKDMQPSPPSERFMQNLGSFAAESASVLAPYSFIISPLPGKCFPACDQVRLYNGSRVETVEKHMSLIGRDDVRKVKINPAAYQILVSVFLMPPASRNGSWSLDYYPNEGGGKGGKKYRVISQKVPFPDKDGSFPYSQMVKAVRALIR